MYALIDPNSKLGIIVNSSVGAAEIQIQMFILYV